MIKVKSIMYVEKKEESNSFFFAFIPLSPSLINKYFEGPAQIFWPWY